MQEKINELRSLLPSVPFVAEQIGIGLKYAQESCVEDEGKLAMALDWAIFLTKLANEHSNPNFYAYRPILCALLSVVEDERVTETFKTETNSVLVVLEQIREYMKTFDESLKKATGMLATAIMGKKEDFSLLAMSYLLLKAKSENLLDVVKVAYASADLRLNGFEMTGALYETYNKLLIALNKANF